ncbi:MAG TPA: hypothetical protein VK752_17690 [Bryobacteraceae bacterium]|jgi:hypothetical protein|nr:hypothetical protein [Bryobacteraceae bacterium]
MLPSSVSAGLRFIGSRLFHQLEFREPEVEHFDARFGRKNVRRFQVAMRDRFPMRRFERSRKLNRRLQRQIERHRTLDFGAFYVLHHDVVRPDVVDLADVRMIQRGDGAGFALKSFSEFFGGNFDGDDSVESGVAGFPHFAHPAGADGRENFVRAEFVAG